MMRTVLIALFATFSTGVWANEAETDTEVVNANENKRIQLASLDSVKLTSAYVIGGEVDVATMREDLNERLKVELEQDLVKEKIELD